MSMSSSRARISALCLGTLFVFITVEAALRIRKGSLLSTEHQILKIVRKRPNPCLSERDPRLGWKTSRNQTSWVPAKRDVTIKSLVSSNNLGLRNNSKATPSFISPGFLALGDSFTFGDEVSDSETWPAFLEHVSGIPIFNAGACVYGLDQSYIRYQELVTQLPLKGVIIEITPDHILRTERKGMLTSFFKRYMTKPYFTINTGNLQEHSPTPLDPHVDYEKLDFARNVFGYSFFFDFIFRKTALNWWWGIVKPNEYPASLKTEFKDSEMSCKLLQEWQISLKARGLKGYILIQGYFKSRNFEFAIDKVKACAEKAGFRTLDIRPFLEKMRTEEPQRFTSLWINKKGGHLSAIGNGVKAKWIFSQSFPE